MRNQPSMFAIFAWIFCLFCSTALNLAQEKSPSMKKETKKEATEPAIETSKEISDAMQALIKKHKLPGIVAGYQNIGGPLVVGVAGVRKTKTDEKMTVEDQLHLGSCTKAITATMIARLVDQKKLSWDMTIAEGLPSLHKKFDDAFHNVTLKQLLMHRGGVPKNAKDWWAHSKRPTVSDSRRKILIANLAKAPKNKPGTYRYSNLGYTVVALMAAKATGKSWEKLIRKEIFKPLDLKTAGFGPPGTKGKSDQPWGHISLGKMVVAQQIDNPPAFGPAGRIHMSMADWAKFCLEHARTPQEEDKDKGEQDKDSNQSHQFISDESLKILHQTLDGATGEGAEYALGWNVLEQSWGGRVFAHSGSNTTWFATVWVSPRNGTVYMAATNAGTSDHIDGAINDLSLIHI